MRLPMRRVVVVVVMVLGSAAGLAAAHLCPESVAGWNRYVSATEARIARELRSPRGFLALDFAPESAAARRAVLAGEIVVESMETTGAGGAPLDVESAMVHHWRGAILIPRMTVSRLVAELQQGAPPARQEELLESRVLERKPDWMRVSLKLQRRKFVTVVYNTEHVMMFSRVDDARATSISTATKIAEVADVNTPQEHELPAGDDRGFLWRLNTYWRYQQVGSGVVAECESITLSRDIPAVVKFVVRPLVERAARESMTRTLVALRARFPS
jgi:hypothetical protein